MAHIFGPENVFVLSVDDKPKIPIGLTVASNQVTLLMCMEYEVSLPDLGFVFAVGHKLMPSVYAGFVIIKDNSSGSPVCNICPMYIVKCTS